jgi:ribosomal protein L24E
MRSRIALGRRLLAIPLGLLLGVAGLAASGVLSAPSAEATPAPTQVFDSIPSGLAPTTSTLYSQPVGHQTATGVTAATQIGAGVAVASTAGPVTSISVELASEEPGTGTFPVTITAALYNVSTLTTPFARTSKAFTMPYHPSSSATYATLYEATFTGLNITLTTGTFVVAFSYKSTSVTTPVNDLNVALDYEYAPSAGPRPPTVGTERAVYVADATNGTKLNATTTWTVTGHSTAEPAIEVTEVTSPQGYWTVAADGGIFSYGAAQFHGSMGGQHLNAPVVGMATNGTGYWLVAADGGIFAFTAPFYGSMGGKPLNKPVVGMAPTATGTGYYEVASDGGVFAFTAPFYGSMGGKPLNAPVVGIAVAATGTGYYEVASDGGVFAFGTAPFYGSLAGDGLDVVGIMTTTTGYDLITYRGQVYAYNSPSYGSTLSHAITVTNIVGGAATAANGGYRLVGSDGGVFDFGDAQFFGSMGGQPLNAPMVGIASIG